MKTSALLILSLVLLSFGPWIPAAEAQPAFRIITHRSNPVATLTKTQVSKILLKKVSKWEHGEGVKAVDQGGAGTVREIFTKEIHGRSVTSIKRYWQRVVFSGDGTPPPELGSDSEVVEYVSQNAGAIGYVSADASLDGVRVISITE